MSSVRHMSNDPNRPGQDHKSEFPESWNVSFYHRIVRTTIGQELRTTYELRQGLPDRIHALLLQMNEQQGQK